MYIDHSESVCRVYMRDREVHENQAKKRKIKKIGWSGDLFVKRKI
jgi:hypothetical protein